MCARHVWAVSLHAFAKAHSLQFVWTLPLSEFENVTTKVTSLSDFSTKYLGVRICIACSPRLDLWLGFIALDFILLPQLWRVGQPLFLHSFEDVFSTFLLLVNHQHVICTLAGRVSDRC